MAEALTTVKRELGRDAVILHTRTYKQGGVMGFGAQEVVEVTAGVESDVRAQRLRQKPSRSSSQRLRTSSPGMPSKSASQDLAQPTSSCVSQPLAGDLIRRTYQVAKAELEQRTRAAAESAAATAAPPAPLLAPPPSADAEQMAREMEAVKRMVGRMLASQRQRSRLTRRKGESVCGDMSDALFDHYLALLEQEVTEELAEEIIQQVRENLAPHEQHNADAVRTALSHVIAELVPADPLVASHGIEPAQTKDGRPRTIALVGPTGVGKTTTIAKLAANFRLKHNKRVGLITMDTYRIAAVEQLRTYANIIGVPLQVVVSPDELGDAVRRCSSSDVVLIDTAGRSQRDDPKLEQLAGFIRAANPHEVHLCLSSTCTQKVMLDAVDRFSRIRTDRIIFTKLDEAVSFGVMLNVMRKVRKRLSFVTTGQEVPHHIEPGRPDRMAQLMLGGSLCIEAAGSATEGER